MLPHIQSKINAATEILQFQEHELLKIYRFGILQTAMFCLLNDRTTSFKR